MNIVETAKKYCGKQETTGSNRGPIVDRWKGMVSATLATMAIPWCGCFVLAMLRESFVMTRKQVAEALGFENSKWFPESTDSWLQQARIREMLTASPVPGDFFLLMRKLANGKYSSTDAYHIGIVAGPVIIGREFETVEGNAVSAGEGKSSYEGDSVAVRKRIAKPGAVIFIRNPLVRAAQKVSQTGPAGGCTTTPPTPAKTVAA